MIKSRKVRIYPTKEQEASMWRHIGSCRFVWNYMLALQQRLYIDRDYNAVINLSRYVA